MNALTNLFLLLPTLTAAFTPPQRPLILDELKAGNVSSSEIKRECFNNFEPISGKNETVCINQWQRPSGNVNWGEPTQYCGYVEFDSDSGFPRTQFYFWLVMSENKPRDDPLVLWLPGGPGDTALAAVFAEWGPMLVDSKTQVESGFPPMQKNPAPVTERLTWLFLDQASSLIWPKGTGFSRTGRFRTSSSDAAQDVTRFLEAFLQIDFEHRGESFSFSGRELHIAGESYAGHWIPAVGNRLISTPTPGVNLKSVIIGNGIIDAKLLPMGIYTSFCNNGPFSSVNPKIVNQRCNKMRMWMSECQNAIKICRYDQTRLQCPHTRTRCRDALGEGWAEALGVNLYDIKLAPSQAKETNEILKWNLDKLINGANKERLIAADPTFVWPQPQGGGSLPRQFTNSGDWAKSFLPELQTLLTNEVKVLLYAGEWDLIVTASTMKLSAGVVDWTDGLGKTTTSNRDQFRQCLYLPDSKLEKLAIGEDPYAAYVRVGQLAYAQIYKAGHVSMPLPQSAGKVGCDMSPASPRYIWQPSQTAERYLGISN
ncbi:Alpha/Beta hydrolase protein [Clohesyomyces aquaticus]|uniref:Carboxypeptidase n=1 Tax=Clohesyomyces aquaticus TaxID=1231657 RepID=A0A1Y1ZQS8_9PLEO|nr:Alpha/Beta hydrolase protein [Clohesyomyces aquaticus]